LHKFTPEDKPKNKKKRKQDGGEDKKNTGKANIKQFYAFLKCGN